MLRKLKKASEMGWARAAMVARVRLSKRLGLLPPVPPTVYVELTNRCNLNCLMCDRESMTRKQGFMDMELFRKVIDNAADIRVPIVKLNRFGEPLIHPSLIEMIRYTKSRGIPRVYFTTNATLLTEENARQIIEAGLDAIAVSIDGATPETYLKIRGIPDYERIAGNLRRLSELRAKLSRRKPEIILNTILMQETEPEILAVFRQWVGIVDRVNVIPVGRYGNVPTLSSAEREGAQELRPCHHPFDRLMVFWDGRVTVCCGDVNGDLEVGRFPEERLEMLWKGERMSRLRQLHRAGKLKDVPICLACDGSNETVYRQMLEQRRLVYERATKAGVSERALGRDFG